MSMLGNLGNGSVIAAWQGSKYGEGCNDQVIFTSVRPSRRWLLAMGKEPVPLATGLGPVCSSGATMAA
jgi:hypothetical protein